MTSPPRLRHRHSRRHHRVTHRRWQHRRQRLLAALWPWWEIRPRDVDTRCHASFIIHKRREDCHIEEKRFRQQVRQALYYEEPMPRYRHDWVH